MKLALVLAVGLVAFALLPIVDATPVHPTACSRVNNPNCAGLVCASPDASRVPICIEPSGQSQPGPCPTYAGGCCGTTLCQIPCALVEHRATLGPVTVVEGCSPSVTVGAPA